jgi:hypothetical protein
VDVLELFASWRYEKYSRTDTIKVEGAVEVHLLVLGSLLWRWILDLSPLSHEVSQGL